VGFNDGVLEGLFVGSTDDGAVVGLDVGDAVESNDGGKDGTFLRDKVGSDGRDVDGHEDGPDVDGHDDGRDVDGHNDGNVVGLDVGSNVGEYVGLVIGSA